MRLHPVSEDALMLYLGEEACPQTSARVQAATTIIESSLGEELIDLVPSYASLLIIYDPAHSDHLGITRRVRQALSRMTTTDELDSRKVLLPVYYSPETGADLDAIATRSGLNVDDVITLHCATEYRVYAIGFAPGFAYLGQVDERIATPRLDSPRANVPKGSVAIADRQTAVYPSASPGGWNLIGCCPQPMFDRYANPCMPISVGDRVRFEAIDRKRFLALGGQLA